MHKGNYIKRNDLEEYLNNGFNIKIYEELTESIRFKGLIDPLAFFNLLDQQYNIVLHNTEKPLSVVNHIIKLDLNDKQLHYLLFQLLKSLKRERRKKTDSYYGSYDIMLDNCIKLLDKEYKKMDALLFPKEETVKTIESKPDTPYRYDFDFFRSHMNTLDNEKDKIKYLLDRKSQYMQENLSIDYSAHAFIMRCDIEIQKIKDHLELDQTFSPTRGLTQLTSPLPKEENLFSALEWATIFYYADETKLLSNMKAKKDRMEQFMNKHNVNTTLHNFKTKYYEAIKRINGKNDYPIDKLKSIIPFLKENYKVTVTKVQNDISFLKEQSNDS